ncbi:MAG: helix-turn-helix domain-containing protein [Planctomycetes bacterium]|nr:helix-turn-helix domain-containing protein [Planctomycetota bacterium]
MSAPEVELGDLLRRSLSWRYSDGSHFQKVCHPEGDWRMPPFMVIVCPMRGEYYSRIEGPGGSEAVTVKAGQALVVPRGVRHTVSMPGGGVLHHAHIQFMLLGGNDPLSFFKVPSVLSGRPAKELAAVVRDLHIAQTEPAGQEPVRLAISRQYMGYRILELIAAASEKLSQSSQRLLELHRLESALRFMEDNLGAAINRRDLARRANLSETRFHYVFKYATGLAPLAYLKKIRMNHAQTLLFQTDLPIGEIGESIGYPDIFHFSKIFKQFCGLSPSRYRSDTRAQLQESTRRE